jgi:uncharacterized membrane protein
MLQAGDEVTEGFSAPIVSRRVDRVAKVLTVSGTTVRVNGDHDVTYVDVICKLRNHVQSTTKQSRAEPMVGNAPC